MIEARLSAGVWASALLRRVDAAGDFAAVLHRGDAVAGSIVLVHRTRDGATRALQRLLGSGGAYQWRVAATGDSVDAWVAKQRDYDRDLWVIELDTPNPARFIDGTIVDD